MFFEMSNQFYSLRRQVLEEAKSSSYCKTLQKTFKNFVIERNLKNDIESKDDSFYGIAKRELSKLEKNEVCTIKERGIYTEIHPPFFIIKSIEFCDHCGTYNPVFAFACGGVNDFDMIDVESGEERHLEGCGWEQAVEGFFILTSIQYIPSFFLDHLFDISSPCGTSFSYVFPESWGDNVSNCDAYRTLAFRCQSCALYLPPYSLYMEPASAFFPESSDSAFCDRVYEIHCKKEALFLGGFKTSDTTDLSSFLQHGRFRSKKRDH